MTTKEMAQALAKATFDALPPVYCTTLAAGLRLLRRSPLVRPEQVNERPYSTLLKFLSLGREKHPERAERKALYEELRRQLVRLRDEAPSLEPKRDANRLLNGLERDERERTPLSFPIRGYLEITNFCNLRCPMCGQSYFEEFAGRRQHLPRKAYSEIQKVLPYLDETVATGFGEALVSPYFWEVVEMLPPGGIKRLITNGVLLDKATSTRLMKYPINDYVISFEATDRETYIFVRSADYYEKVIQNICDLDASRQEAARQDVSITLAFVAMQKTIRQLPEFVRRAKAYGADRVQVSFLHVTRPQLIEQSLYFAPDLAHRYFAEGKRAADEVGIHYACPENFEPRQSDPARSRRIRDCYEPWEFVYFEATGKMRPCCIYPKDMGSILRNPWQEVWTGQAYQALRATVNSDRPEPYCAKCWFVGHIDHNDRRFHINLVDKRGVYLDEDQVEQGVWD